MIDQAIRHWVFDRDFLHGRMSFICGPRQIGKTTLARSHLDREGQGRHYINWDSLETRRRFASDSQFFIRDLVPPATDSTSAGARPRPWIVFDEIHKYPKWKNLLKGYYDDWKTAVRIIVTGSARLDAFRRSGDSLVGRYFLFKMFPLHPNDLTGRIPDRSASWDPGRDEAAFEETNREFAEASSGLLELSGFPEPFTAGTWDFYRRWQDNHLSLIIQEDVRDLTKIASLQKLETLVFLLPERVGSPLSLNNLKDILQCAHGSVRSWLSALEKVFLVFHVSPFSGSLKRSVVKEKKYYFWDWGVHDDPGRRLENFVAVQLQRAVAAWNEWGRGKFRLTYVRTRDGREADFLIVDRNRPRMIVECKAQDDSLSPSLAYIKDRLAVPFGVQVRSGAGPLRQIDRNVYAAGLDRFLSLLP
ncbi:MAG: ATP-binding protein [Candidatus Aminicenantes bacterium]|nr:ATP-binding protein [Candidatus Aminicenantes bacterium]